MDYSRTPSPDSSSQEAHCGDCANCLNGADRPMVEASPEVATEASPEDPAMDHDSGESAQESETEEVSESQGGDDDLLLLGEYRPPATASTVRPINRVSPIRSTSNPSAGTSWEMQRSQSSASAPEVSIYRTGRLRSHTVTLLTVAKTSWRIRHNYLLNSKKTASCSHCQENEDLLIILKVNLNKVIVEINDL